MLLYPNLKKLNIFSIPLSVRAHTKQIITKHIPTKHITSKSIKSKPICYIQNIANDKTYQTKKFIKRKKHLTQKKHILNDKTYQDIIHIHNKTYQTQNVSMYKTYQTTKYIEHFISQIITEKNTVKIKIQNLSNNKRN